MEPKKESETAMFATAHAANDTQLQNDFDDLVARAAEGDRQAVGAISVALGPWLLKEARTVLKGLDEEAEDVVQDFLLFLLEARGPFNRANGPAIQWMHRLVREIARQRRRERIRDPSVVEVDD